jgi:hypothetical protein
MNPDDPSAAQVIVAEYARVLEQHHEERRHPASVHLLPYPKQTLKRAIYTSLVTLTATEQLTGELLEFLETLYVSLADYVDDELATLMREYREAGDALVHEARAAHERQHTSAWQSVAAEQPARRRDRARDRARHPGAARGVPRDAGRGQRLTRTAALYKSASCPAAEYYERNPT